MNSKELHNILFQLCIAKNDGPCRGKVNKIYLQVEILQVSEALEDVIRK